MSQAWVPVTVAILIALGLFLVIVVAGTAGGVSTSPTVDSSGRVIETSGLDGGMPWSSLFAAMVVTLPMWASVAMLVGLSPLWESREKLIVGLLIPSAALLTSILPMLGWWLGGIKGSTPGPWTALIVVIVGGGWLAFRLIGKASARVSTASA